MNINSWSKSGKIAIWRYEPKKKNFPGWHMACDSEGYQSLKLLLSLLSESDSLTKRTLVLDEPDLFSASSTLKKTKQDKLVVIKSESSENWHLKNENGKLTLEIGAHKLNELVSGINNAIDGKYDFSVGSSGGQNLWFW